MMGFGAAPPAEPLRRCAPPPHKWGGHIFRRYRLLLACALLIRAARDLLIPFFFRASYVFGFLIDGPGFLPGIDSPPLWQNTRPYNVQRPWKTPGMGMVKALV